MSFTPLLPLFLTILVAPARHWYATARLSQCRLKQHRKVASKFVALATHRVSNVRHKARYAPITQPRARGCAYRETRLHLPPPGWKLQTPRRRRPRPPYIVADEAEGLVFYVRSGTCPRISHFYALALLSARARAIDATAIEHLRPERYYTTLLGLTLPAKRKRCRNSDVSDDNELAGRPARRVVRVRAPRGPRRKGLLNLFRERIARQKLEHGRAVSASNEQSVDEGGDQDDEDEEASQHDVEELESASSSSSSTSESSASSASEGEAGELAAAALPPPPRQENVQRHCGRCFSMGHVASCRKGTHGTQRVAAARAIVQALACTPTAVLSFPSVEQGREVLRRLKRWCDSAFGFSDRTAHVKHNAPLADVPSDPEAARADIPSDYESAT